MKGRALAALLGLAAGAAAQTEQRDEQRAAWSHARSVAAGQPGAFAALSLPPELLARCRPDLADLRLVAADGRELPYVVDRARERDVQTRQAGRLLDTRREHKRSSQYTVELDPRHAFDTLLLTIHEQDFAKQARVEASDDRAAWRELASGTLFDRPWGGSRLRHTRLELAEPARARYLRVTLDDARSRAVSVTGVEAMSSRPLRAESWSRRARLEALGGERGTSRYAVDGVAGLPFETLRLDAADAAFSRRARLLERTSRNGRGEEVLLGEGELYRVRVADALLAVEALTLAVKPPAGGELVLEVRDDDSPPLRAPSVVVEAAATRLLFLAEAGPLSLYYGNPLTRPARYDLDAQRNRIAVVAPLATAELGPERRNPRFRAPVPLAFTPERGAPLAAERWARQRPFTVAQREDLYSVTLQPADLAVLRPDLADLRVVDGQERQVPFLVEADALTRKVELRVEPGSGPGRHRLLATDADGVPMQLPIASLELEAGGGFFSRPARVRDAEAGGRAGLIAATTLARAGAAASPRPLEIAIGGGRYRELLLELDEGDDAPLAIGAARALVRVPRLVFKAAPGRYRVLLGNREAARARYDIASLRHEFLTYSAVPLEAEPLSANPARRRRLSDYWSDAPPALVLWATLLLAVVALLALTVRALRQPSVPPEP